MNSARKYRDSLLSALCIISWFVIVFRIFNSIKDESAFRGLFLTYLITIVLGIIGGIVLMLLAILKKRKLKHSFIYNLFGTLNIIIGFLGLIIPKTDGRHTPYLIAASLTVGVVIYKHIYGTQRPQGSQ